jgi:hypothetical protein
MGKKKLNHNDRQKRERILLPKIMTGRIGEK